MEQFGAEQKFWSIPEAVETLVLLLDPESTLNQAQSFVMEKEWHWQAQGSGFPAVDLLGWNKIRSCWITAYTGD